MLSADETNVVEYLNGTKPKLAKLQDADPDKLKQLSKLVIFSCASKVEKGQFDKAAVSTHETALKAITVSFSRLIKIILFNVIYCQALMTSRLRQSCLELLICHPVLLNAYSLHSSTTLNQFFSEFLIGIIPLLKERPSLASMRQKTLHGLKKSFGKDGSNFK
jgi:hypothetical protein